jgi:hypothetical protein
MNAKAIAKAAPDLKQKGVRVRIATPLAGFKDHNSMVMEASVADRAAAFEAVRKTIEDARDFVDPLDALVERAKTDPGAAFESEVLEQLSEMRRDDPSRFERLIARLKKETKCRITELMDNLNRLGGDEGDQETIRRRRRTFSSSWPRPNAHFSMTRSARPTQPSPRHTTAEPIARRTNSSRRA